jgi:predicted dehydrogenase
MKTKTINWGVIGTGYMATRFIRSALKLPEEHNINSILSRSRPKAKYLANSNSIENYSDNLINFLENPSINAVYIATPLTTHYDLVKKSLSYRKIVLCEKPLFQHYYQYENIDVLLQTQKLQLNEALWVLYLPHIVFIIETIKKGIIGEPLSFSSSLRRNYDISIKNRILDKTLGGGAFNEMAIYAVALAYKLFGLPINSSLEVKRTSNNVDVEHELTLVYSNNFKCNFVCSFVSDLKSISVVHGTRGSIKWGDLLKGETKVTVTRDKEAKVYDFPNNGLENMLLKFHKVRFDEIPTNDTFSFNDSLSVGKLMCQIRSNFLI